MLAIKTSHLTTRPFVVYMQFLSDYVVYKNLPKLGTVKLNTYFDNEETTVL